MNTGYHPPFDPELLDVYGIEAEDHLASITDALMELRSDPTHPTAFHDIRRRIHTLKGAAATVGMMTIANLAHRLEDLLDHIHATGRAITPDALYVVSLGARALQRISREADEESQMERLRDLHAHIDAMLNTQPETHGETAHRGTNCGEMTDIPSSGKALPQVLRVSRAHLEDLMQMVSQLSLHRSGLDRDQRQLVARIQSTLSAMRMLPLQMLAPRLHRILRVTAQQEDKKAVLILQGGEINVDTTVIEQMVDPFMHLLRNAVAHGIELPAVRKALGKPEQGTIELRARVEDQAIVVDIEDDGAGFNFPAIRKQAVSSGLLSASQAEKMSQSELCRIVLFSGFSTARTVSQVSGRGVGMDIVQEALEPLHGSISIHSVPGRRTVVTLRVPMPSLAVETDRVTADCSMEPARCVMIVDDSPSMRRVNASLIRKAGFAAITATDGLDALDKLQRSSKRPDAIILDVEMPRMDGFALLENLRNRREYDNIPIILLTSRGSEQYRKKAQELAVSAYLIKPCSGEALINHLQRLTREQYG